MKLSNRGFTLVEMLATITILGIITAISMPVITGIKDGFTERKFDAYKESLLTAGKLYIDAYWEDVFGSNEGTLDSNAACYNISLKELQNKNLVEDISSSFSGAVCDENITYVRVVKSNGVYSYDVNLECTKDRKSYKFTPKIGTNCNIFP